MTSSRARQLARLEERGRVSSIPGVQKPHWSAAWRVNASSSRANSGRSASPSTSAPRASASAARKQQEDTGRRRRGRCTRRRPACRTSAWRRSGRDGRAGRRAAAPAARSRERRASVDARAASLIRRACPRSPPAPARCRIQAAQYSSTKRSWYLSARMRSASSCGIGRSSPSVVAIACSRTARSSVIALSTAQRTSSPRRGRRGCEGGRRDAWPSALGDRAALLLLGDQLGRLLEVRDAVGEEDGVVGEELELGRRGAEARSHTEDGAWTIAPTSGRARRSPCGGRSPGGGPRERVVDLDDVVGHDLVERDALALDVDGLAAGGRALTWPSVRSEKPSSARMRQAHATCSRTDCAVAEIVTGAPSAGSRGAGSRRP